MEWEVVMTTVMTKLASADSCNEANFEKILEYIFIKQKCT